MKLLVITQELSSSQAIRSSDFLKEVCASTIALYPQGTPELPWAGYLAEEKGVIVGTCAYKSPPVSGEVEIAYFTFPEHGGRGVATRMAQHLVDLAAENGITRIRAQTLPEKNASTRILEKLGFILVGPAHHPEDGEVWEWKK
jgi:[ribosomal protein S5]-alanine N-acetyltransferase